MSTEQVDYYVLFHNHTEGLKLYRLLRERGIAVRISPAPRLVSVCCGMSLLAQEQDVDFIRTAIDEAGIEIDRIVGLPRQINPRRDTYC